MKNWYKSLDSIIDKNRTKVFWNKSLRNLTTFRIGGKAECLIVTNCDEEIKKIVKLAKSEDISLWVIGNGSNLLISDQEINGITLKLGNSYSYVKQDDNTLTIGASTRLSKLVQYACLSGLSGVEFLWGIPGTFGGAVVSNAGAFSHNIGEKIVSISGITPKGEEVTLNKSELKFEYRKTKLPLGFIITKGVIELISFDRNEIKKQMDRYLKIRKQRQPWGASAGSVFKNPHIADCSIKNNAILKNLMKTEKVFDSNTNLLSAGKLIDKLNLKGLSCGGAYVSKKHGNFIINRCNAKAYDVYELIQIIKCKVELNTGIILQEEIQIIPKIMETMKWHKKNELATN
ncbi:MAG: UDP-N-acetylmuramate dehydrogenase [candidate division WOR-3 bacterium]|nr:UDP-N-acetylmuramate dehydrogenase [candidate division WOR-3 bacterium]